MPSLTLTSDHVLCYNDRTFVIGLDLNASKEAVREKIIRYFPKSSDLKEGYRVETMLLLPVKADVNGQTSLSMRPLASLSFEPKKGNERYVLMEKRDPETTGVIFKDDDTFFEDDPRYGDIQEELVADLVANFEFYAERFKETQDTVA